MDKQNYTPNVHNGVYKGEMQFMALHHAMLYPAILLVLEWRPTVTTTKTSLKDIQYDSLTAKHGKANIRQK